MQTLNNSELAFLSVISYPDLTAKVLKMYADHIYIFAAMFTPHLNMMWNAYVRILKKYRTVKGFMIEPDVIAANLSEAVQADRSLTEELKLTCDNILVKFTSRSIPDKETGIMLISHLVKLENNRQLVAKVNANSELEELQESLNQTKEILSSLDDEKKDEESVGYIFRPLRDIAKLALHVIPIPTGINFLDEVTSGGGRAGELWLVLGAPASGKTIFTEQLSCAQAMLGNNTLWATYEQPIEGDIAERMIANITDTNLDIIRDKGFLNLPQDIQDKYWSSVAGVSDFLTCLDIPKFTRDPSDPLDYGGIHTIEKVYYQMKAEGRKPKMVILDWFGSMMSRISSNLNKDLEKNFRFLARTELAEALYFARTEKILMIVMHQLDVKGAEARPTTRLQATQAQDMHSLQDYFTLVMTLGKRDVNNILYFDAPKARRSGNVLKTIRMVGEKARFVMENGWLPDNKGNFYRPGAALNASSASAAASTFMREIE